MLYLTPANTKFSRASIVRFGCFVKRDTDFPAIWDSIKQCYLLQSGYIRVYDKQGARSLGLVA